MVVAWAGFRMWDGLGVEIGLGYYWVEGVA